MISLWLAAVERDRRLDRLGDRTISSTGGGAGEELELDEPERE